jgi:heterodisulfide reductase subunit A
LNPYLFHMANIREHCSWVHAKEPAEATEKAKDLVKMAVAEATLLEPQTEPEIEVQPSVLVIGGGVSGISASVSLARQGFSVHLVEKTGVLGGKLNELYNLYPTGRQSSEILEALAQSVKSNSNITLHVQSTVKKVEGFIGNFKVTLKHEDKDEALSVGTIIVATGAEVFEPTGMYGYSQHPCIITQFELEHLMREKKLEKPKNIVMIQCVGARENREGGRNYCSRICCVTAVKNALNLKEKYPNTEVSILYRDMQTYGKEFEAYYQKAREKLVQFIRFNAEDPPEVIIKPERKCSVRVHDIMINDTIELDADLIVLSTPLVQTNEAKELSKLLKVPLGPDGFFLEAHVKLRPVDFATEGIFVCGTAHSPKTIPESISQACAAAARAGIPMAMKRVRTEAITAMVNESVCTGCGTCITLCPYNAIQKDERGIAKVNDILCKGCGVCAASCPEKAIIMKHFSDKQLLAEATATMERQPK